MLLRPAVPTAAAVSAVCLFVALGLWQLDRAGQKQVIHDAYLENREKWAVSLNELSEDFDFTSQLGRAVEAKVSFLDRYLVLDNQPRYGRPGYLLLAAFAVDGTESSVMVNLGWVPAPPRREQLPSFRLAGSAPGRILGRLAAPPAIGLLLGRAGDWEALAPSVYRIQTVDFTQISAWLERPALPALVEIDPDQNWGFDKTWRIPGSGAERHRAYAVQWFCFAAIAALLWLFLSREGLPGDE
jgi:surfeit locus 1 family protein